MSQAAPAATATAPATAPDADTSSNPPSPSFKQRLDAAEELWVWKLGLRVVLIIVAVIGCGCIGWAVSESKANNRYSDYFDDRYTTVWGLITWGVSAIWCAICILVLFLRRPNAPVHPGVAVGIDLILWLSFIWTAPLTLIGAMSVLDFDYLGSNGLDSYYGSYEQAPNGTWVWNNQTASQSRYSGQNQQRDCERSSNRGIDGYGFASCAEEDAYVNYLWSSKDHRAAVEMCGAVCQFISLALHLALFVWACVDTHRRKRRAVSTDAQKLAADIVMNMIRTGAMVPAQNQDGMQQPLLHPQQHRGWPQASPMAQQTPQQNPQQYLPHQQPQGWPLPQGPPQSQQQDSSSSSGVMAPQPAVTDPEKGDSARFA